MTMKYHVASCAMTSKIVGTLSPGTFDFFARKMINEKAIRSDAYIFIGKVSAVRSRFEKDQTHRRRGRCLYTQPLLF